MAAQRIRSGFKPANNELGSSVRQSARDPMNGHLFFFSFDSVLSGEASKPASGGLPSWGRPSLKKTLAVPVFIVQNDRAWSSVSRSAATVDRAEIGRICGICGKYQRASGLGPRCTSEVVTCRIAAARFPARRGEFGARRRLAAPVDSRDDHPLPRRLISTNIGISPAVSVAAWPSPPQRSHSASFGTMGPDLYGPTSGCSMIVQNEDRERVAFN